MVYLQNKDNNNKSVNYILFFGFFMKMLVKLI